MMQEVWYRFDERHYEGGPGVYLDEFPVIKHTPKGVQLDVYGKRRFVLNSSRKRYACKTKQEAIESYIARKERQKRIYQARVAEIETAIDIASWIRDSNVDVNRFDEKRRWNIPFTFPIR